MPSVCVGIYDAPAFWFFMIHLIVCSQWNCETQSPAMRYPLEKVIILMSINVGVLSLA